MSVPSITSPTEFCRFARVKVGIERSWTRSDAFGRACCNEQHPGLASSKMVNSPLFVFVVLFDIA